MLLSHAKAFIYVKTVKTAGTSVEVALERFCRPDAQDGPPPESLFGIETDAGIIGHRGKDLAGARWFNHMPAHKIRAGLDRSVWRRYLRICNIRNPWDKTVSWFHFKHPDMQDQDPKTTIAAFRTWLANSDKMGQDFWIYTIKGRPVMDVYLRHDRLEQDVAALADRLNLGEVTLPRLKSGFRGRDPIDYRSYYDKAAQAQVEQVYARCIAAFDWRFDRLAPGRLPVRSAPGQRPAALARRNEDT